MNKREKEILKNTIEYFQDKLDNGCHKIFYNDLMWDEKTVDIINLLNEILENFISKDKIREKIKELEKLQNESKSHVYGSNVYGYGIYFLKQLLEE